MKHYPGWWWSSTMQDLIGYESLLERECIMAADFDSDVTHIVSQPFQLQWTEHGVKHTRVPDFLLLQRSSAPTVVDVKPAHMLRHQPVAESLAATGRVLFPLGWRYVVWTGLHPVVARNLRLISSGRRMPVPFGQPDVLLSAIGPGPTTLGELAGTKLLPRYEGLPALFSLLWHGRLSVDMQVPLDDSTFISVEPRKIHEQ